MLGKKLKFQQFFQFLIFSFTPKIFADAFVDGGKDPENGFPSIPPSSILSIDLELVSFKPVINVTGDLGVLKKIVKEGEGTLTANEGAAVTSKYAEFMCILPDRKSVV